MKPHRLCRRAAALLVCALLVCALSVPACADGRGIDPDREGSVSMSCSYLSRPVSGGDMALYRVADVEQDDGSYYFRLRDDLGGERLDQKGLDAPDLANRIASAPTLGAPDQTLVFDAQGKVLFRGLKPGLYLLRQNRAASGYEKMLPVLVSLPWFDPKSESYLYDIDATVKPETARTATPTPPPTTPPGPKLPQTGQLNWPVPVMAGLGLLCVISGAALLAGDQRRKQR